MPQCRRILLDEETRHAYDTQWQLHFLGASDALSYPQFLARLRQTHERVVSGLSEVDEEELELLPAVVPCEDRIEAEIPTRVSPEPDEIRAAVTPVIVKSAGDVAIAGNNAESSRQSAPPSAPVVAKQRALLPVAALGALALLAVGGWLALGRGGGQNSGGAGRG